MTERGRRLVAMVIAGVLAVVVVIVVRDGDDAPPAAPPAGDASTAALVQAPASPQLPAAGIRLSGTVVDGTNAPVAGIEVTASPEPGAADRALAVSSVDAGMAPPVPPQTTSADGRFAFDGLAPGRYHLHVRGPGILAADVRYVPVPSDEMRVVVARQVVVAGVVRDGGQPVAQATVGLRGEAIGGTLEARTDAQGAFVFPDLPEGRYQVFAWHDTLAARTLRVNRLGAGPFAPVELALEAGAIVVGRVVDRAEGTGLVAAIELRPSGEDQAPRYARSQRDGSFRIEGVPHGRWIDAYAPGYTSPGGVELEAGRGIPEVALARAAVIEGRVVDADGTPIASASVRAVGVGGGGAAAIAVEHSAAVELDQLRRFSGRLATLAPLATIGSAADPLLLPRGELGVLAGPIPPIPPPGASIARPAVIDPARYGALVGDPAPLDGDPAHASIWTTGADGRFRIRGVARGKVAVLATAPGYAEGSSRTIVIDAGQLLGGIDVVLGAGTQLVGRVTDQHGAPVAGAQVRARPALGGSIEGFSDADGRFAIGPIAGTVEVTASAFGHADSSRTLELAPARGRTVAERQVDLVLVVADAILAGTLDDETGAPVGGARLEVVGGAGAGRQVTVAADGTFSLELLPAGPLRVRVTHPAYPTVELDALAVGVTGAKARLRVPVGGAIEGAILDDASGAPLPNVVLAAHGPGGATADATSDRGGRWTLGPLRPGAWSLAIEQPGYLPTSRTVTVPAARVPGTTTVHDVRFDLQRGALVGGTVRDARGRRVPGASVVVESAVGRATGTTDAEGEFRIRDAPTGEVNVHVTRDASAGSVRVTLRPGDEVLGLALELR